MSTYQRCHWTPANKALARQLRRDGLTWAAIGARFGTSGRAVSTTLATEKDPRPCRGARVWTAERITRLKALVDAGLTHDVIGRRMGLSHGAVSCAVARHLLGKRRGDGDGDREVWGVLGTRRDGAKLFLCQCATEAQARRRAEKFRVGGIELSVSVERVIARQEVPT
jgi:hypothetical protein